MPVEREPPAVESSPNGASGRRGDRRTDGPPYGSAPTWAAARRKPARRTREIVRISGDAAMRPRSAHDPVKDKCRSK
ncbi:hypothetical protein BURPS668_A1893 [Burkholderia pseudomallei 668]|nr:hypothetical protein BURPS668_A1893 [Burkholderia pseudomallei 668]